jgi:catechol-2,3-dioxygenase
MRLNHINLTVTDVPVTRQFLEAYFGLRALSGNNNLAVLLDDGGLVLTLTSMKVAHETTVQYPANFHIGFCQETEARVNEINRRLKADGFDVPPPSRQHGAWTFCFRAPGGFTIEVLAALDEGRRAEESTS